VSIRTRRWLREKKRALSLADAVLLGELLANTDPARYEEAALRWLSNGSRRALASTHRGRVMSQPRRLLTRNGALSVETSVPKPSHFTSYAHAPRVGSVPLRASIG
jgi:hypothetical protein